jgi:hypothetical protein
MATDKEAQVVTVRLPMDEYEMLRTFAFVTKSKINEVVRKAVLSFLAQEGRQEEMDAIIERVRRGRRLALDKLAEM